MKTGKKFTTYFEKTSQRTAKEIKIVCDKIQDDKCGYNIRSNGNHIWVELGETKQQYWSPMLHLRIENNNNQTFIKGEFAENPKLWVIFIVSQITSIVVFIIALIMAYFRYKSGLNFNAELFIMFGMVSVWFAIYLLSENYKRKGAGQIKELQDFVDYIAAA